jgi:hypothetical protein
MPDIPVIEMVVVEGRPLFQVSGLGIVIQHQQLAQAHLQWHCQAVARGWTGPAPVVG